AQVVGAAGGLAARRSPGGDELVGLEVGEVLADAPHDPLGLGRRQVPEQDHLAGLDLEDLDVVDAARVGERDGGDAAADVLDLVGGVRPHEPTTAAASSSPSSPR